MSFFPIFKEEKWWALAFDTDYGVIFKAWGEKQILGTCLAVLCRRGGTFGITTNPATNEAV